MKPHTTNYENTFIAVADDCPAVAGEVPPMKGDQPTVARLQYDLIRNNPYRFTSDDVIFQVHAVRTGLTEDKLGPARTQFFSRGQPCLRSSPLTKRYGWGVHCDAQGRVAIYGRETEAYERFLGDGQLKVVKAMKSGR